MNAKSVVGRYSEAGKTFVDLDFAKLETQVMAFEQFKAELRKLLATIRREQSNLDRLNRYTHLTRSMRDDRNLSCDRIADANRRIEEMLR